MVLQQVLQIELAGAFKLDEGAAMQTADLKGGLGAAAKAQIIRAVPDHLHEAAEVRQIVGERPIHVGAPGLGVTKPQVPERKIA